jgi:hypothetical protein
MPPDTEGSGANPVPELNEGGISERDTPKAYPQKVKKIFEANSDYFSGTPV